MTDEELRKKKDERNKQLRDRELSDIRDVAKLPEGRRLLWRIMSLAGIFRSSFTGDNETFLNEGKRLIGLPIFNDVMKVAPEKFLQMQREYKSEQEALKKEFPAEADEL